VASGGFSDVWKGSLSDGQVVAIKRPRISLLQMKQLASGWSREIVLWRQLTHPNVLPLYGIYQMKDSYNSPVCMVSPWMKYGNVVQFLDVHSSSGIVSRSSLVLDIASGLDYLHQQSIIQGDLKGATKLNVLVKPSLRACIADFGLSTIAASQIPRITSTSSNRGGTLAWQAPETMSLDHPTKNTPESDIYSFACVCYEVLRLRVFTGKPPFCESEMFRDVAIMLKVLAGERPARPSSTQLTDTIWECVTDCWKQRPEERLKSSEIVHRL
ncbi:kinase-like domain-containing protein, partial [Mycena vulgaris]